MKQARLLQHLLATALFLVAIPSHAQTTTQVNALPFTCIDQTSFYCYNAPVTATVNGQSVSGTMTLDIFHMSYGYVLFVVPGAGVYGEITAVQVISMNSLGQITEMKVGFTSQGDPDNDGDSDTISGSLDLNVKWTAYSSGGGRGSHNVIWRPAISGSASYASD